MSVSADLTTVWAFIIAFAVFLVVKWVNKLRGPIPAPKDCPFCLSAVPLKATRCPHCTSQLAAGEKRA